MTVPSLSTLPIGSVVQVSSEDEKVKYLSHLVGVEPDKVLITSVPNLKQLGEGANYDVIFGESKTFIFRMLGTGVVYGFKSQIISRVQCDANLLISSFPREIQTRNLRKESRYPCTLAAELQVDQIYAGLVTNISAHGCQFCIPKKTEKEEFETLKNESESTKLSIHFPFNNESTEIKAIIKSVNIKDDENCMLGMAFEGEPNGVKLFLESLHLDAIASFLN